MPLHKKIIELNRHINELHRDSPFYHPEAHQMKEGAFAPDVDFAITGHEPGKNKPSIVIEFLKESEGRQTTGAHGLLKELQKAKSSVKWKFHFSDQTLKESSSEELKNTYMHFANEVVTPNLARERYGQVEDLGIERKGTLPWGMTIHYDLGELKSFAEQHGKSSLGQTAKNIVHMLENPSSGAHRIDSDEGPEKQQIVDEESFTLLKSAYSNLERQAGKEGIDNIPLISKKFHRIMNLDPGMKEFMFENGMESAGFNKFKTDPNVFPETKRHLGLDATAEEYEHAYLDLLNSYTHSGLDHSWRRMTEEDPSIDVRDPKHLKKFWTHLHSDAMVHPDLEFGKEFMEKHARDHGGEEKDLTHAEMLVLYRGFSNSFSWSKNINYFETNEREGSVLAKIVAELPINRIAIDADDADKNTLFVARNENVREKEAYTAGPRVPFANFIKGFHVLKMEPIPNKKGKAVETGEFVHNPNFNPRKKK